MSREKAAETPKPIMDMVLAKWNAMKHASDNTAPDREQAMALANENAALAAQAIKGGRMSSAWREYMMQFVERDPENPKDPLNPAHLARLLAADDTYGDPVMDRKRAYLLGNAVCGGGSTGEGIVNVNELDLNHPLHFAFTVGTIDEGL